MRGQELKAEDLYDGRRVYVSDLDVFGRVHAHSNTVVCEAPMPGYVYEIKDAVRPLRNDDIGDRDSEN
jgi:hypothetical protein